MTNEKEITRRLFEKQCSYEKDVKILHDLDSKSEEDVHLFHMYHQIARTYADAIRIVEDVVSEDITTERYLSKK